MCQAQLPDAILFQHIQILLKKIELFCQDALVEYQIKLYGFINEYILLTNHIKCILRIKNILDSLIFSQITFFVGVRNLMQFQQLQDVIDQNGLCGLRETVNQSAFQFFSIVVSGEPLFIGILEVDVQNKRFPFFDILQDVSKIHEFLDKGLKLQLFQLNRQAVFFFGGGDQMFLNLMVPVLELQETVQVLTNSGLGNLKFKGLDLYPNIDVFIIDFIVRFRMSPQALQNGQCQFLFCLELLAGQAALYDWQPVIFYVLFRHSVHKYYHEVIDVRLKLFDGVHLAVVDNQDYIVPQGFRTFLNLGILFERSIQETNIIHIISLLFEQFLDAAHINDITHNIKVVPFLQVKFNLPKFLLFCILRFNQVVQTCPLDHIIVLVILDQQRFCLHKKLNGLLGNESPLGLSQQQLIMMLRDLAEFVDGLAKLFQYLLMAVGNLNFDGMDYQLIEFCSSAFEQGIKIISKHLYLIPLDIPHLRKQRFYTELFTKQKSKEQNGTQSPYSFSIEPVRCEDIVAGTEPFQIGNIR